MLIESGKSHGELHMQIWLDLIDLAKPIEHDVGLVDESRPVYNREIFGETGKAKNEMIFPSLDCLLHSIGVVIIWWNILESCILCGNEVFNVCQCFIVHFVHLW